MILNSSFTLISWCGLGDKYAPSKGPCEGRKQLVALLYTALGVAAKTETEERNAIAIDAVNFMLKRALDMQLSFTKDLLLYDLEWR